MSKLLCKINIKRLKFQKHFFFLNTLSNQYKIQLYDRNTTTQLITKTDEITSEHGNKDYKNTLNYL